MYEVCGLRIRSELPLPAPLLQAGDYDVDVTLGPAAEVEYQRPTPDVVAEIFFDGWARYSFCRSGEGYVARFYGLTDFDISGDLRRVRCRPDPRADPGVAPIVVCGGVVAFLLMARGRAVLHASAVEVGGTAVAFAGPSGCGKSTLAALLCSTGARLVTDDNLPLIIDDGGVRCDGGTVELRLRPGATHLADEFPVPPPTRITADERLAVSAPLRECPTPELAAVILPLPMVDSSKLEVDILSTAEAVHRLAQCYRVTGWRAPEDLRRSFDLAIDLARRVPVLEMRVPWGHPFREGLAAEILSAAGLEDPETVRRQAAGSPRSSS